MNSVEVKVNVINQLKLLRQSTFKDKLSFLDEDIQNAQRAKSTRVDVSINYTDKKIVIENNGKILKNPQALFSIAESEWDEDIQKTESPFGMGFFSNITVSDKIEVISGSKHITFNVSEMIQNNKTNIEVKEYSELYRGFKLILNNFDFSQVSASSIRERIEILGKYIHELDIYCDGTLQPKKDITEGDGSVFLSRIESDTNFKGWIALSSGFSPDLKVFYKGRLVTKVDSCYYVRGDIHITDKALNLTSPDRKDIIRDSKYSEFLANIKKYILELANQSFLSGSQINVERHIDAISNYADKNKLKKEMTFLVLDTEQENDSQYLTGIAIAKKENSEIKTTNQYEVYIRKTAANQTETNFFEVSFDNEVKNKAPEAEGIRTWRGSEGSSGGYSTPEIDPDDLEERQGVQIDFESEPVFWLSFDEVVEQERKLNIAKHYKLKIIVSRNKFEDSILEILGREQNIIHISQLTEKTNIKATISNTYLSDNEKRALMLLDMISRMIGFNHNVFAIGDVMVIKETSIEVLNHTVEKIEDDFIAVHDPINKKIYIDRTTLNKSKLRLDVNENLDLEDYKFILINLKEIIRELSLMEFKKSDELYESIINTLAIA